MLLNLKFLYFQLFILDNRDIYVGVGENGKLFLFIIRGKVRGKKNRFRGVSV